MNLNKPILLFNFKAYRQAIGKNALKLAKIIASSGYDNIYLSVQPTDILSIKKIWSNIMAEHVDPVEPGARTGWLTIESIINAGAIGTLINHSEHRMNMDDIKKIIERAKTIKYDFGLDFEVVSCADTVANAEKIAEFKPDAIAIEPPELIGSKISISEAKPELITETILAVSKYEIPVLCGAGINKNNDVAKAIELGARGVLVASAFVKNDDPKKWLNDIISIL